MLPFVRCWRTTCDIVSTEQVESNAFPQRFRLISKFNVLVRNIGLWVAVLKAVTPVIRGGDGMIV